MKRATVPWHCPWNPLCSFLADARHRSCSGRFQSHHPLQSSRSKWVKHISLFCMQFVWTILFKDGVFHWFSWFVLFCFIFFSNLSYSTIKNKKQCMVSLKLVSLIVNVLDRNIRLIIVSGLGNNVCIHVVRELACSEGPLRTQSPVQTVWDKV